jgi:hypothetical protein
MIMLNCATQLPSKIETSASQFVKQLFEKCPP